MQVLENSHDRLVVEDRPVLLGCLLAIAILVPTGVGLAMLTAGNLAGLWLLLGAAFLAIPFVVFLRRVRVIFDRGTGSVTLRSASLLGESEQRLSLADIRKVGVETSVSRQTTPGGSVSRTHRAVLYLADSTVPLTEVYSGGDGAARIAEVITLWLGLPPSAG